MIPIDRSRIIEGYRREIELIDYTLKVREKDIRKMTERREKLVRWIRELQEREGMMRD